MIDLVRSPLPDPSSAGSQSIRRRITGPVCGNFQMGSSTPQRSAGVPPAVARASRPRLAGRNRTCTAQNGGQLRWQNRAIIGSTLGPVRVNTGLPVLHTFTRFDCPLTRLFTTGKTPKEWRKPNSSPESPNNLSDTKESSPEHSRLRTVRLCEDGVIKEARYARSGLESWVEEKPFRDG